MWQTSRRPEGLVSITELARMRGISTDRLRHYDKIGLLKPAWRDPDTGVRYYSLALDDDILGTIVELRELDIPLADIQRYFEGRNLTQSLGIFRAKQRELESRIAELIELKTALDGKVAFLEHALASDRTLGEPSIAERPKRTVVASSTVCRDATACNREAIALQRLFRERAPILATNRLCISFGYGAGSCEEIRVGLLVDDPATIDQSALGDTASLEELDESSYVCLSRRGDELDMTEIDHQLAQMRAYCETRGLRMAPELLEFIEIDQGLTDLPTETLFTLEARIWPKE